MKVIHLHPILCALVGCILPGILLGENSSGKSDHQSSIVEEDPATSPMATPTKKIHPPKKASPNSSAKRNQLPPAREPEETPAPIPSPAPSEAQTGSTTTASHRTAIAPNATINPESLAEFAGELPRVRKLIETALELTKQDLTYSYGSDDPANGGMDCSGFVYFVLRKNGFANVPRDASSQYVWLRKAGTFRPVLSQVASTFELDELRPGDLLFWVGSYDTQHDPPVSHVMIYLGTDKETHKRLAVGSSDGRTYQGKPRWGVSVFDFPLTDFSRLNREKRGETARFVGYARPPGLRD